MWHCRKISTYQKERWKCFVKASVHWSSNVTQLSSLLIARCFWFLCIRSCFFVGVSLTKWLAFDQNRSDWSESAKMNSLSKERALRVAMGYAPSENKELPGVAVITFDWLESFWWKILAREKSDEVSYIWSGCYNSCKSDRLRLFWFFSSSSKSVLCVDSVQLTYSVLPLCNNQHCKSRTRIIQN